MHDVVHAEQAFLESKIPFPSIAGADAAVLDAHIARGGAATLRDLDDVFEADAWARDCAREWLASTEGVRL